MQKLRGKCINLMHLFIATRGEIFRLKFTKYLLAAGLRPEPLGELKRSPRPPSRNKVGGATSKRRGREGGQGNGGGKGRGRGGGTCSKLLWGDRRPWVSGMDSNVLV